MDLFKEKTNLQENISIRGQRPLADRMRPRSFAEFSGHENLIGEGKPLRVAIDNDKLSSAIFWGPPGSGKTTLAELIARATKAQFVRFSAVTTGIKEVKEMLEKAANYFQLSGRKTVCFIDEIHRFNKAQQDAFLPYVEHGDIILIGATTENPSFEVNSALLSRARVFVLSRLTDQSLIEIIKGAINDQVRGVGIPDLSIDDQALLAMAAAADGDARRALTLLESVAVYIESRKEITVEDVIAVNQKGTFVYDKSGEEHYNLISALHKTIRGGDPDAALYWLARMLNSGEEPMYVIRRLVRFATEDIGLADPYALTLCINARDSFHFLGSPEGELAIAQAVIYMACAPKSNALCTAYKAVQKDVEQHGSLPVPLWIRNAPTSLMKGLDYGKGYQYAHDYDNALTSQEYFPEQLAGKRYYHPTDRGQERQMTEYLKSFHEFRKKQP